MITQYSPGAKKLGAVFFDRDGVLNEEVEYLYRSSDFRWITGARQALKLVQDAGLLSIVVTNQSGVARGYYTEGDVDVLHAWIREDLSADDIVITDFYTCPFLEDANIERYRCSNHPDRKPNPGMILRAIDRWNIDRDLSFIVGDKMSDIVAGERAGIRGVLFRGGNLAEAIMPLLKEVTAA